MMTLEEKVSIISSIPKVKGIFGFAAETEKTTVNGGVLQKSRKTKVPTPVRFHKITTIFTGVVFMGDSYQEMVNKVRDKEGLEPDFEARPTYCSPVTENNLVYQHKKSGQLYLRVYTGYGATMTSERKYFDAYGKEIDAEEYLALKEEYLKKDSDSSRQGVENEIRVLNYKVENVTKLKRHETWIGGEMV